MSWARRLRQLLRAPVLAVLAVPAGLPMLAAAAPLTLAVADLPGFAPLKAGTLRDDLDRVWAGPLRALDPRPLTRPSERP